MRLADQPLRYQSLYIDQTRLRRASAFLIHCRRGTPPSLLLLNDWHLKGLTQDFQVKFAHVVILKLHTKQLQALIAQLGKLQAHDVERM